MARTEQWSTTEPAATAATENLRIRQYSDSATEDAQQLRHNEDHVGQRSDAEANEQIRVGVARSLRADVASLFAQIPRAKANGSTSDPAAQSVLTCTATAPPAISAPEDVRNACQVDTHSLSAEEIIALKRTDARMTVTNAAAQAEKQPVETKPVQQPRLPGLTLQCWPRNTKKS